MNLKNIILRTYSFQFYLETNLNKLAKHYGSKVLPILFEFASFCLSKIASTISWLETNLRTSDSALINREIFEK